MSNSASPHTGMSIAGMGRCIPRRIVLNAEIEQRCKIPHGWIAKMSGVMERRWAAPDETAAVMGARAAEEAVKDAGLQFSDLDLIVNASGSPQQAMPDGAPLFQRELGLGGSGIACLSIHATCLSFLVALDVCNALIQAGRYHRILVISSELATAGLNYEDAESASLFGDGAAAAVLVADPTGLSRVNAARLETYGESADLTAIPGCGTRKPPNHPDTRPADNLFHMDGRTVYMRAVGKLKPFIEALRPGLSTGMGAVQWVVPHQPSALGLRSLRKFNYPEDRIVRTLERLGNCIAASIPLTLYEAVRDGRIQRGDELFFLGTGAGLSIGGVLLTY